MITGGNDHEQQREGDTAPRDQRYARTREAIQIYKRAWTSHEPFDFHVEHYSFDDFVLDVEPFQQPAGRRRGSRWRSARSWAAPSRRREKAYATVARIQDRTIGGAPLTRSHKLTDPENAGSQRLLAVAVQGERHDRALWTVTARATGGAGNSTALVGTPETVAAALLDYYDLGVRILSARGYDLLADAREFGREVIPLVRSEVARREELAAVG